MAIKNYRINLDGEEYIVEVEELAAGTSSYRPAAPAPAAAPAPQAAPAPKAAPAPAPKAAPAAPAAGEEQVLAPLQGSIFDVRVSAGQAVKAGDELVVIEAMKMENEVVAPRDGVVVSVHVSKGDAVSTDDLLVVLK